MQFRLPSPEEPPLAVKPVHLSNGYSKDDEFAEGGGKSFDECICIEVSPG